MALQVLIELVLGNVGKHFIVDLVCRAVGNPERQNETSCPGRSSNLTSHLPGSAYPRASSARAKQRRQREHRSVNRLQGNSFPKQRSGCHWHERKRSAAQLWQPWCEPQALCPEAGEKRKCLTLWVREGEGSAVTHLGPCLMNALPPQETLTDLLCGMSSQGERRTCPRPRISSQTRERN